MLLRHRDTAVHVCVTRFGVGRPVRPDRCGRERAVKCREFHRSRRSETVAAAASRTSLKGRHSSLHGI